MNNFIDIFICSYLRQKYTGETIRYLKERTRYPYRLWLLDNGGNEEHRDKVDFYIPFKENIGIHPVWQIAFGLAESDYFITSDNDIFVPNLEPDWLTQMVKFMDERPDYGAISLHPHVLIGAASFDSKDPEDVKEVNMAGAVMRILRRDAVYKSGGWERVIRAKRNHEESTISSRLQDHGYKTGRTTKIRAYHPFGKDIENNSGWGYEGVTPEEQGHRPELAEYVLSFDNMEGYDNNTWIVK